MIRPIFSASWYRVAGLTPRLRSHAEIHRHQYRGETWYVLRDLATERFHRFTPAAYWVISLMDGRRTVQQIWDGATERLGDDAPTQDDTINLLAQLHAADVLQCDVAPDTAELFNRYQKQQRRLWQSRFMSLFAWKIPLLDPERLLVWMFPLVRPFAGWLGALLWLGVVGPAVVLAGVHWSDLTHDILDWLFGARNLAIVWLLFPAIKILHELGHGVAVKAFGGEVHDMGVMVLVLTPVPYVDASSASALANKWQRIIVGAAGMLVELFVASLALFLWLSVEPGMVRTLAHNAILIGGISTLLFNGNPLLRYDGYYILADLLEIPNLGTRSNAYLGYLCERYLFGQVDADPPQATPGERRWFVFYAVASFLYRVVVIAAILLFIADHFFTIGVILALAAAIVWVGIPVAKGASFLLTHPRIRKVRPRAIATSALIAALVLGLLALVPLPYRTMSDGVIWLPEEALVRAGTEGFIDRVLAKDGAPVRRGDVLIVARDPELAAQIGTLSARVRELQARYDEAWGVCDCPFKDPDDRSRSRDLVKAEIINQDLHYARRKIGRASCRERV